MENNCECSKPGCYKQCFLKTDSGLPASGSRYPPIATNAQPGNTGSRFTTRVIQNSVGPRGRPNYAPPGGRPNYGGPDPWTQTRPDYNQNTCEMTNRVTIDTTFYKKVKQIGVSFIKLKCQNLYFKMSKYLWCFHCSISYKP